MLRKLFNPVGKYGGSNNSSECRKNSQMGDEINSL
jgi:hypothetical protein